jgi:hypothetical protein
VVSCERWRKRRVRALEKGCAPGNRRRKDGKAVTSVFGAPEAMRRFKKCALRALHGARTLELPVSASAFAARDVITPIHAARACALASCSNKRGTHNGLWSVYSPNRTSETSTTKTNTDE